jgi:signal recognition particle subunit SRP72
MWISVAHSRLGLTTPQAYRAEDFEKAAATYRELSGDLSDAQDEEYDLRINSAAVDAQLEWAGRGQTVQKKKPAREDLEAFETAYNAACCSIARGELAQAEVCLRRAKGPHRTPYLGGMPNYLHC